MAAAAAAAGGETGSGEAHEADRIVDWVEGHLSQQRVVPSWAALKDEMLAQFPGCDIPAVKPRCQELLMAVAALNQQPPQR